MDDYYELLGVDEDAGRRHPQRVSRQEGRGRHLLGRRRQVRRRQAQQGVERALHPYQRGRYDQQRNAD
jgi:hypothetical protein